MKSLLATTSLVLSLAFPAFAQDYTPDPAARPGGSIVITYKDDVATLDPAIGYDWQNWSVIKAIFDGLMDYEPGSTKLRPDLAESYTISDDGQTYTFKLRDGLKFHNGRAVTAADVRTRGRIFSTATSCSQPSPKSYRNSNRSRSRGATSASVTPNSSSASSSSNRGSE